jgi:Xaa-Pro aminopeptidase
VSATDTVGSESYELRADLRKWLPPHRRERLRNWMREHDVDCLVGVGPAHVNYVAAYSRYYGSPAAVILGHDGGIGLLVMRDEVPIAQELSQADAVAGYGERGFGINLNPYPILLDAVLKDPAVSAANRIGVADESGFAGAALADHAETVAMDSLVTELRRVKDEDELVNILHGYQLCWTAQRAVAERTEAGDSQIEIFSAAQRAAQIAHGGPIEFLADLLSGTDTAKVCSPIHVADRTRVGEGDAVVADIVIGADGYWGDNAETHFRGHNEWLGQTRSQLLEILRQSAEQLRPGKTGAALFEAMADRIGSEFSDGEFPHHGGHAVGLTSFEDPHVIPSDDTPFESGMVIALEPGVYFPSRGGARVENLFLVTPDGGVELRAAFGQPQ